MKTIQNLTTKDHFGKYDVLVKTHGLTNFKIPFKVTIKDYMENKYLNSIPLKNWDMATFYLPIKSNFLVIASSS